MDTHLEIVVIPVSDVDRPKAFALGLLVPVVGRAVVVMSASQTSWTPRPAARTSTLFCCPHRDAEGLGHSVADHHV